MGGGAGEQVRFGLEGLRRGRVKVLTIDKRQLVDKRQMKENASPDEREREREREWMVSEA
jgi:hypothetical protein